MWRGGSWPGSPIAAPWSWQGRSQRGAALFGGQAIQAFQPSTLDHRRVVGAVACRRPDLGRRAAPTEVEQLLSARSPGAERMQRLLEGALGDLHPNARVRTACDAPPTSFGGTAGSGYI